MVVAMGRWCVAVLVKPGVDEEVVFVFAATRRALVGSFPLTFTDPLSLVRPDALALDALVSVIARPVLPLPVD